MNEKGEAVFAIVLGAFIFILGGLLFNSSHGWEYHVKDANPPVRYFYGPLTSGQFEIDYWRNPEVQLWSFVLLKKKFPNAETKVEDGMMWVWCKRWFPWDKPTWKRIACDPTGKFLYIGVDRPPTRPFKIPNKNLEDMIKKYNKYKKVEI